MDRLEKLCIDKGMRMTDQRRVIARVLSAATDHPDVEELHRRAHAVDPHISIATVYRTVRLFEESGIIERHDFRDGRSRYEELLRAGIRVYEYQPTMMHAKTFIIDGMWGSIGSMNFDNRSLAFNNESNFVFLDAPLGAQMDSIFLDDLTRSTEIKLETFQRRPWYDRVIEYGAAVFSRLL